MEPLSASDAQSLLNKLSTEYDTLADTRKNLEEECKNLKKYIQSQATTIQTIVHDIEKLRNEYEKIRTEVEQEQPSPAQQQYQQYQQQIPQQPQQQEQVEQQEEQEQVEEAANLTPLVDEKTIKHPVSVSLYAEILDQSVICSTAFSPDSVNLAIGSDNILRVYNFERDQFILEAPIGNQSKQETNHVRSISWTPDSQMVLCGAEDDNIYVFQISNENTNEPIQVLQAGTGDVFQVLCFPQGGKFASAAADGIVQVWDLKTFKPTHTFQRKIEGPDTQVVATSISISPNGKIIASGYSDKVVCFWDLEKNEQIFEQTCHNDGVYSVLFLPDGKRFVTSSLDKTVKIWNITPKSLELWKCLEGHTEFVLTLAIDPTGQWLLSGSKDLSCILTRVDEGRMLYSLKNHTNSVITVAFNPNGKMFCTGSGDKFVKIWNFSDEEPF